MTLKRKLVAASQIEPYFSEGWALNDITPDQWTAFPYLQRRDDTFALMGSADLYSSKTLNGFLAIAGFDHLVYESNPMAGEPAGNAYHYIVSVSRTHTHDCHFEYCLSGPYRIETTVPHWFDFHHLENYLSELE